jgi:hypothetical protein
MLANTNTPPNRGAGFIVFHGDFDGDRDLKEILILGEIPTLVGKLISVGKRLSS